MEASSLGSKQKIKLALLCLATIAVLAYAKSNSFGFLQAFSQKLNDIKFQINPSIPDSNIIFVDIDHLSIKEFGRWPWPRSKFAKLLEHIQQSRIVALDMVFSEPTQEDEALAEAMRVNNLVQGVIVNNQLKQISPVREAQKSILLDSALHEVNLKSIHANTLDTAVLPLLEAAQLNGSISTFADSDGLFRQYPLGFEVDGVFLPALSMQVIRLFENANPEMAGSRFYFSGKKVIANDEGTVKLNWFDPVRVNRLSVVEAMQKPADFFKDKVIYIGLSEAGLSDIRSTPFGQIPGVFLHITFLSNYLNQDYLNVYPILDYVVITVLCLIPLLLLIFNRLPFSIRVAVLVMTGLVFFAINLGVYWQFNAWLDLLYPLLGLLVASMVIEYQARKYDDHSHWYIKNAFKNYLSPKVIDELIQQPEKLKLGGEKREITVLFCDVRNFTTLSEAYRPEEIVDILHGLFNPLTKDILDHSGLLDKYIGDAIMALYNAPIDDDKHALNACLSAKAMMQSVRKFNEQQRLKSEPEVSIGVGIHTGDAVVGNIGSDYRFSYTAIGDTVNTASRIEGQTKTLGYNVLISETVVELLPSHVTVEYAAEVELKGKREKVSLYGLLFDEDL